MILDFKEKFRDGSPTFFIEKIWRGLLNEGLPIGARAQHEPYAEAYRAKFGKYWDGYRQEGITPKIHSIRAKKAGIWMPGRQIHCFVNSRTPDCFRFAPTLECCGIRSFSLWYGGFINGRFNFDVDGRRLDDGETLARNDGFDDIPKFTKFLNRHFHGDIIHWTNFKY
jgi:hypothetical protein